MSLHEQIKNNIKEYMKAGDKVRLEVMRGLVTAFTNELVSKGRTPQDFLTDEEAIAVITRLSKQRKDSIEKYNDANRNDLAEKEKNEIDFLSTFLPKEASKEDIVSYIIEVISKGGGNMGSYIKEVKLKFPTSDGKFVADEVKKNL